MSVVENVEEHEDGSATFTIEVTDEEKERLVELGVNYAIILAMFNTNTSEVIKVLEEHFKEG